MTPRKRATPSKKAAKPAPIDDEEEEDTGFKIETDYEETFTFDDPPPKRAKKEVK